MHCWVACSQLSLGTFTVASRSTDSLKRDACTLQLEPGSHCRTLSIAFTDAWIALLFQQALPIHLDGIYKRLLSSPLVGSERRSQMTPRLSYPDIARGACPAGKFVCQLQAGRLSLAVGRPSTAEIGRSCIQLPRNDILLLTADPFRVTPSSMLGLLGGR